MTATEPYTAPVEQTTIPIGDWVVYTVNCGECAGEGGQAVRGHDGWVDCPYCTPAEDCSLCGDAFPTKDREPDQMLVDGRPQPVCRQCFALEPSDD